MVLRTIEMREIGFNVPDDLKSKIIKELKDTYHDDIEIEERDDMIWVKGDLHNRYKRRQILYILSGGKIGENV